MTCLVFAVSVSTIHELEGEQEDWISDEEEVEAIRSGEKRGRSSKSVWRGEE